MTRDDAFIELLAAGVEPEEAKILLDAVERDPAPIRPDKPTADAEQHQPVWALFNRPFGYSRGFRMINASDPEDSFNYEKWKQSGGHFS